MHESCKIIGLSYGYPTVMLRLSFGKDSIMGRKRVGMERRWNMCGCRQNGDGLQKTFRSIGVLSSGSRRFVVVDSETMEFTDLPN